MQRQVKAKSLSVKIPKNEPTTVRLKLRARERRVPNARTPSLCFGALYGSSETSHRRSTASFSEAFERVAAYLQVRNR
jgi:hypothetical protein